MFYISDINALALLAGNELERDLEELKPILIQMQITLGWTPLHCIAEQEKFNLAVKLIQEGSDVNTHDRFNRTPLSIAASKGNLKLIELLLKEGADANDGFPLHFACEKGQAEAIKYLIKNGADVNLEKDKNYPILIATAKVNLKVAKILIENGADVDVVNGDKETALHWACESGNEELIAFLIDAGCDIDAVDKFEITPLSVCLIRKENKPELVKLLLEKGASSELHDKAGYTYLHHSENSESTRQLIKYGVNVNAQNKFKETPLYNCTFYGHIDCAKTLLEQGADPNIAGAGGWSALHSAAKGGVLDHVEELLKRKADVNLATAQNIIPLHLAASQGHLQVVEKLLDYGSLVNVPIVGLPDINSIVPHFVEKQWISDGITSLNLAASSNHLGVCKLLLTYGANFHDVPCLPPEFSDLQLVTKTKSDWPCNDVIVAVRKNHLDEIKKLSHVDNLQIKDLIGWSLLHHAVSKENNADPNCVNGWGETALHQSCRFGDLESVRALLKHGANKNAVDIFKDTPLHCAVDGKSVQIVRVLLENGANIDAKDRSEWTALHHAVSDNFEDGAVELIKAGCSIDSCTEEGETPLFMAAENLTILKALVEHNADVNFTNFGGWTPLHQAAADGNIECVEKLLQFGAKVNEASAENVLPIYVASIFGNFEIVKELLHHHSYVNLPILDVGIVRLESGNWYVSKRFHIIAGNTPLEQHRRVT